MKTSIFFLSLLLLPLFSNAEIKIVEVANGKAVIQFDKEDDISAQSVLVKKDLSLGKCTQNIQETSTTATSVTCPVCKECKESISPQINEARTHLVGGYINSFDTKYKIKGSNATTTEKIESTELDLTYLYNFEKFALGASYGYVRSKQETTDSVTNSLDLVGRYFFIENKAPNMFIPYIELNLTAVNSSSSSPDFSGLMEGRFKGAQAAVGFTYFINSFGFIDARYMFGNIEGDYTVESNTVDAEITGNGLALGFGIAFN